jgi:hypothetical protein
VEVIEQSDGEVAGVKSVCVQIEGKDSFGWLKGETGVHRLVRYSPFDSNVIFSKPLIYYTSPPFSHLLSSPPFSAHAHAYYPYRVPSLLPPYFLPLLFLRLEDIPLLQQSQLAPCFFPLQEGFSNLIFTLRTLN